MTINQLAEWRGWIWVAITVFIASFGGVFGLFVQAEAYTDRRVHDLRSEICDDIREIKGDLSTVRSDIKQLLRDSANR